MHDLFISYASENSEVVLDLVHALYRVGITDFWWDRSKIRLADSIPTKIDEGIANSRYLLAVITKEYFSKHWTRQELDAVRMLQRPVIPVWLGVSVKDVSEFSPALAARRAVEYVDDPEPVAAEIAGILAAEPQSVFARFFGRREELIAFWGMALHYVRAAFGVVDRRDKGWLAAIDRKRQAGQPTWKKHMEKELGYTLAEVRAMRDELPSSPLSDDDVARAITGLLKRSGDLWFPTCPEEIAALSRAGIDTW